MTTLCAPSGDIALALKGMKSYIGQNAMMAYLAMMAARLLELHDVLKDSGLLYLHCDPTASHYLKILLDAIFGHENFRNEIVWKTGSHNSAKGFGPVHDVIFYTRSLRQRLGTHCGRIIPTNTRRSSARLTRQPAKPFKTWHLPVQVREQALVAPHGAASIRQSRADIGNRPPISTQNMSRSQEATLLISIS